MRYFERLLSHLTPQIESQAFDKKNDISVAYNQISIYFGLISFLSAPMANDDTPTRAVDKWKEAGQAGFQLLPDVLLKKQAELGLASTDLVVLINLTMHWWYEGQRPFPRSTGIAKRMGVDPRTVQRSMKRLASLGMVRRVTENKGTDKEREVFDLSGLVDALCAHAVKDPDYLVRVHRKKERLE